MTTPTPYSPATATAVAIGATDQGYVERTGVTWDDTAATWNLQAVEQRAAVVAADVRDNLAALRQATAPPTSTMRILCAGDSITLGTGSVEGTGYRPWLVDLLARRRIAAQLTVVAEGGKTLRDMAPQILAALPAAQPDLVLIHLGTNDAAQPDMADWQNRYGQLVDQILASNPTVKVACARVGISRNQGLAANEQTINTYVDAAVAARQAGGRVRSADMTVIDQRWTADGVHPLDAGYLRMAQQWLAAITSWLPAAP